MSESRIETAFEASQPLRPAAAPPRRRRTQAERSEATREKLIEATTRLLRTRGYGGLRTSEVSDLAGVSRGAQLHHFPTKNALVIATVRHLNEAMLERSRERARLARSGGDPIEQLIADAFDFFFGDYFFITLAIGQSDERNEELKQSVTPSMGPSRLEVEREWLEVLVASGLPRELAADVLALTLSLVRGFAVRSLLVDEQARFVELAQLWRRIIGDYIDGQLKDAGRPVQTARKGGRGNGPG